MCPLLSRPAAPRQYLASGPVPEQAPFFPLGLHACTTYTHLEILVHQDLVTFKEMTFPDLTLNMDVIPHTMVNLGSLGTEDSSGHCRTVIMECSGWWLHDVHPTRSSSSFVRRGALQ